ncbi:hypothetical protein DSECCO2_546500 [anaerobic digester metagenome]
MMLSSEYLGSSRRTQVSIFSLIDDAEEHRLHDGLVRMGPLLLEAIDADLCISSLDRDLGRPHTSDQIFSPEWDIHGARTSMQHC